MANEWHPTPLSLRKKKFRHFPARDSNPGFIIVKVRFHSCLPYKLICSYTYVHTYLLVKISFLTFSLSLSLSLLKVSTLFLLLFFQSNSLISIPLSHQTRPIGFRLWWWLRGGGRRRPTLGGDGDSDGGKFFTPKTLVFFVHDIQYRNSRLIKVIVWVVVNSSRCGWKSPAYLNETGCIYFRSPCRSRLVVVARLDKK